MRNHDDEHRYPIWTLPVIVAMAVLFLVPTALAFRGPSGGSLSGRVTFRGSPVAVGAVIAVGTDGTQQSANIDSDGRFTFTRLPSGEVKLAVISRDPAKALLRSAKIGKSERLSAEDRVLTTAGRKWVTLPGMYEDATKSGFVTTIKGDTVFDVELK